ncbi:MAG: hypothetical protein K2P45_03285 [Eubacterium sp.]|nr:hypothetical protein [Eubacterium sp.]
MPQDNKEIAEKRNGQVIKISIVSLLAAALFMIELYEIITDPANMVVIGALGAFLLVSVFVDVLFIGKLIEQRAKEQEEAFENVYRSEKASYLLMRKYFDQMDQRMESLGDLSNLPYKELIAAQKALAKAQINRGKQNTNALLISNDRMMQKLSNMQNDIASILTNTSMQENAMMEIPVPESNPGLSEQDKEIFLQGNKDVLDHQQEILRNIKELEVSLRKEILESADKVASIKSQQMSVPQPQMQIPDHEEMIAPLELDHDFSFGGGEDSIQSLENSSESNLDRLLQQMDMPEALDMQLKPMSEEPQLQPILEEPELQPITPEPQLQDLMAEPELQPIAEEPQLQSILEEPELQPIAGPEESPIAEPDLQSIVSDSDLQSLMAEPELQPMAEEPQLQDLMTEPELQPIAEEPQLQTVIEEPELQPVAEEPQLQSAIEEPELQPAASPEESLMTEPDLQSIVSDSDLQSLMAEPELQFEQEQPVMQPIIEEPAPQPISEEARLQSMIEEPILRQAARKPEVQPIAEEPQPVVEEPAVQAIEPESETEQSDLDKLQAGGEITPDRLAAMVANLGSNMEIEEEPEEENAETASILAETLNPVPQAETVQPAVSSAEQELEEIMKAMDINDVLGGDSIEDLDIDKILESPASGGTKEKGKSNQVMSSEEIAALIANTDLLSEPGIMKNDDMMDLSDPSHVMSSDEIAALIANM